MCITRFQFTCRTDILTRGITKKRDYARSLVIGMLLVSSISSISLEGMRSETKSERRQLTFGPIAETEPNISPDGRWIAFQYFGENKPGLPQIWIMEISKGFRSARPLVDQHGYAGEMSWSPDSQWISFISPDDKPARHTDQIYQVNVITLEIIQVTGFPEGSLIGDSTTWSTSGLIAFEKGGIICGVSQAGGKEVQLLDTRQPLSNQRPSYIRFSPDGKMLVFSVEDEERRQSEIWVADLKSKSIRRITSLHFDFFPTWIDERHVLFSRQTENGWSEVQILSLLTGNLERITSEHVDYTPSTDPLGHVLYFSRRGRVPKDQENADFLVGFHIWRMSVPPNLLK